MRCTTFIHRSCIAQLALVVAGILSLNAAVYAQEFKSAPRTDQNSIAAHADLLEKAQQGVVDVFFEGDSITRRWGTTDTAYQAEMQNWIDNFYGWNAANFAWGGDTVQNILWSLENGELKGLNPKVFVLLAGTNNLSENIKKEDEAAKIEEITTGIQAIMNFMQNAAPQATIILTGVLPRNGNDGSTTLIPIINDINDVLATMADGDKILYININDRLADENGKLFEGVTLDGLHLNATGYQHWANVLKPMLTELLGPPKEVDLAPQPTGNPAARE